MSDQLVFTAPSVRSESVVTYLQSRGVADESISVVGNTDAISADLPDGGFLENDTVKEYSCCGSDMCQGIGPGSRIEARFFRLDLAKRG